MLSRCSPHQSRPRGGAGGRDRIELDATGAGTLLYGEPADLPAIEDPYAPYLTSLGERDISAVLGAFPLFAGFRYRVYAERGRSSEMSFLVSAYQPWGEWCALQQPISGRDCYSCDHDGHGLIQQPGCGCALLLSSTANVAVKVHCGRAALCLNGVCACDESACFAKPEATHSYTVTMDPVDTTVLRFTTQTGSNIAYLVQEE